MQANLPHECLENDGAELFLYHYDEPFCFGCDWYGSLTWPFLRINLVLRNKISRSKIAIVKGDDS